MWNYLFILVLSIAWSSYSFARTIKTTAAIQIQMIAPQPNPSPSPNPTPNPSPSPTPTPTPSERIPIIVAQGLMGRTTISCDDGVTWVANRSFDLEGHDMVCGQKTPVTCGSSSCSYRNANGSCGTQGSCDCVHHPGYGKGIAFSNDRLVLNFGWGSGGVLLQSSDAKTWATSLKFDASELYPGIVYNQNKFIHFSSSSNVSDDGLTWRKGGFANFNGSGQGWISPRAFNSMTYGTSSRLIAALDGNQMRVSSDNGATWFTPNGLPGECTNGIGNSQTIATGNNVAVIITDTGKSCRSGDGGVTWTIHTVGANLTETPVFANGVFLIWSRNGVRYSSTDGQSWTATSMKTNVSVGVVGVTVNGILVATNGLWEQYGSQRFMRSTDNGLTWSELPSTNYVKSHLITRFKSGFVNSRSVCQ